MYLLAVDGIEDPAKVEPTRLKLDRSYYRVPNCALFDCRGNMTGFGFFARRRYQTLKGEDLIQAFFFEKFKMQLQHDKVS